MLLLCFFDYLLLSVFSYLAIKTLERKQWVAIGSADRVWAAVHQYYYIATAQDGSQILASKPVRVVEGIVYDSDDDEDE
jgi:hypothetical protein